MESMPGRLQLLVLGLLVVAFSACAAAPPPAPEPRPPGTGRVQVAVTGVASAEGQVLIALFLDERGWPDDEKQAFAATALPIHEGQAEARFEDVPAGPFAVSVFHDKNRDRKLDTGLFGIPTEDYGFSRDARGTFGPPRFKDARLELAAGESKQVAIRVGSDDP
jgi:uncharacterized protein (DUF2141 family)